MKEWTVTFYIVRFVNIAKQTFNELEVCEAWINHLRRDPFVQVFSVEEGRTEYYCLEKSYKMNDPGRGGGG